MRAKLLYNPVAGRNRESRLRLVQQVTTALQDRGFTVQAEATYKRGSAAEQSKAAVQHGAEAVFACGGDGTVHDVLQGIVGADEVVALAGGAAALTQVGALPLPSDTARLQALSAPPLREKRR